ncbi:MAG: TonB-dependent receptor, partial [Chitinophagaceae bacterium]
MNFQLDSSNRLFLSGYFGRDVFGFHRDAFNFDFVWGNATGTARWNHIFSPRLFMNTTATYTNYNYEIANKFDRFSFKVGSNVQDYTLKSDFDYALHEKHALTFGVSGVYHRFGVGRLQVESEDDIINIDQNTTLEGTELGAYISDDWDISTRWKLTYGLRGSGFVYKKEFYKGLEPRAAVRYRANDKISLKASYTNMNQYVHLLSNTGIGLPTDLWVPTTDRVKPQQSEQIAVGIAKDFADKGATRGLTLTVEGYYKTMNNIINYREGASFLLLNDPTSAEKVRWEDNVTRGKGWSYGAEVL